MPNPLGVMFTATADLKSTLAEVRGLGVQHGQMAIPGDLPLDRVAGPWRAAIANSGLRIHTLFGVYSGESYADIPTVRETVGFIPRSTRDLREKRTLRIVELAAELEIAGIATHVGFVPEDPSDTDYLAVREMVRRIADVAARHNITFALETGQESAAALLQFLIDANRPNVGVNFDPANMILYGAGDPVNALATLGEHVLTVHAKDGILPSAPGSLGTEMPVGKGAVDFPAFLAMLDEIRYKNPLFIERECEDPATRLADIRAALLYLNRLQS